MSGNFFAKVQPTCSFEKVNVHFKPNEKKGKHNSDEYGEGGHFIERA